MTPPVTVNGKRSGRVYYRKKNSRAVSPAGKSFGVRRQSEVATALWFNLLVGRIQSGIAPDKSGLPPHSKFTPPRAALSAAVSAGRPPASRCWKRMLRYTWDDPP